MTNQLTPLQCPSCGGLLRSLDARVWQCAYCKSRYMLLGEETPVPGLTRVATKTFEPDCSGFDHGMAEVHASPILVGESGPEIVVWKGEAWKQVSYPGKSYGQFLKDAWPTHIGAEA